MDQLAFFTASLAIAQSWPAGLWGGAVMATIAAQGRRSVQATVDSVSMDLGAPRTLVHTTLCELEAAALVRSRVVKRHHLAFTLTDTGRTAVAEARHALEGVAVLAMGGVHFDHSPAIPAGAGTALGSTTSQ